MRQSQQETLRRVENLVNLTRAKNFLGQEFLTWFWCLSESETTTLEVRSPLDDENYTITPWIDDRLVLESAAERNTQALRGGSPSESLEAAAALRTGKKVKEMKIGMEISGLGEFTCLLNAADLAPKGLRVPELEIDEATESDSIIEHKILCCEAFTACLDGLFLKFLDERIEEDWESSGLDNIKSWLKARTKGLDDKLLH